MSALRSPASGKVRAARLTDLAALGELSRLCQIGRRRHPLARACRSTARRSASSACSGCRSVPSGRTTCCSSTRRTAGSPASLRVERESGSRRVDDRRARRDRDRATAGDIRFRLVQHLLREGAKRGAVRFHVACADADGNVELFMQAGFARYGEERVLFRRPTEHAARAVDGRARRRLRHPARRRRSTRCRWPGSTPAATPAAGRSASRRIRLPDWERQGAHWRVPRSSLDPDPALRRRRGVSSRTSPDGGKDGTQLDGIPPGRRGQGGPAPLPQDPRPARRGRVGRWSTSVLA